MKKKTILISCFISIIILVSVVLIFLNKDKAITNNDTGSKSEISIGEDEFISMYITYVGPLEIVTPRYTIYKDGKVYREYEQQEKGLIREISTMKMQELIDYTSELIDKNPDESATYDGFGRYEYLVDIYSENGTYRRACTSKDMSKIWDIIL